MAHNVETMAFHGEKPWHGLGVELPKVATSVEMIKAAGLDWKVKLEDLQTVSGTTMPGWKGVVRHRTGKPNNVLGCVSQQYVPVQPADAFSFFDGVVGAREAMYHTAGSLGHGERMWVLAKLPGTIQIIKNDVLEKFVLLTTGFDGLAATVVTATPIRVVCQNTLNAALAGTSRNVTMRFAHRGDLSKKLDEAREALGVVVKYYDTIADSFKHMAGFKLSKVHTTTLLDGLFPLAETDKKRAGSPREKVMELLETGAGTDLAGVKGTAWGFYNAVTEFVDHFRKSKGTDSELPKEDATRQSRLASAWMGSGRRIKDAAFAAVMEITK